MQPSTIGFTEDCAGGGATSLACVEHVSGRFRCIGGNETNALGRSVFRRRIGAEPTVGRRLQQFYLTLTRATLLSLRFLVGGYPCQGCSSANRDRLLDEDPRTKLALYALWMVLRWLGCSVFRGGSTVVAASENVPAKETDAVGTVQAETAFLQEEGYCRSVVVFCSHEYGGSTYRVRPVAWSEPAFFVSAAGPPQPPPGVGPGPDLITLLQPLSERPRWSRSTFVARLSTTQTRHSWNDASLVVCSTEPSQWTLGGPTRVGFVEFGGETDALWSSDGLAWAVTAWGPPPRLSGRHWYWMPGEVAGSGEVVILTALECFLVQGFTADEYWSACRTLRSWDYSDELADKALRQLAGNAITRGVAGAIASLALRRIDEYDALLRQTPGALQRGAPKSLPTPSLPVDPEPETAPEAAQTQPPDRTAEKHTRGKRKLTQSRGGLALLPVSWEVVLATYTGPQQDLGHSLGRDTKATQRQTSPVRPLQSPVPPLWLPYRGRPKRDHTRGWSQGTTLVPVPKPPRPIAYGRSLARVCSRS